jgi:hypothetical protein
MISQLERSTSKYLRGPSHAHEKDASYSLKKKEDERDVSYTQSSQLSFHYIFSPSQLTFNQCYILKPSGSKQVKCMKKVTAEK